MESANQVYNYPEIENESPGSPLTSNGSSSMLEFKKKTKSSIGIRPSMGGGRESGLIGSFASSIAAKKSTLFRKASIVYPKERSSLIEAKESPFDLNFNTLKKRERSILAKLRQSKATQNNAPRFSKKLVGAGGNHVDDFDTEFNVDDMDEHKPLDMRLSC
jgi:hypothetical protein